MPIDLTPVDGLDVGDTRTLKATFTDSAGSPTSVARTDIILTVKEPGVAEVQYTDTDLTDGGTGIVTRIQKFTKAGRWSWRWDWSNGSNDSESEEAYVLVGKPRVTPSAKAQ